MRSDEDALHATRQLLEKINAEIEPHRDSMRRAARVGIDRGDFDPIELLPIYMAEMNHFFRIIDPVLAEQVRDQYRNQRTFELIVGLLVGFAGTIQQEDFLDNANDATCEWLASVSAENLLDLCLHQLLPILSMSPLDRAALKDYRGLFGVERCRELQIFHAAFEDCTSEDEIRELQRDANGIRDMRLSRLIGNEHSQWWSMEWQMTMRFALQDSNDVLSGQKQSRWPGTRTAPKKRGWFS